MKKEDVKVDVTPDHVLTITAERKSEERSEEKGGFVRMERSYGSFARAFRLPEHVDLENIRAELKEGVLQLTVPKRDVEEPKKTISVQVA
jgi:HSP20 family protein